ncbi:rhodanese-like domain-containing protein [Rathayibacter sp. YIM 133350]|uniref:sulfurtransferase n=1 Tax=Rathayibacter sp. YIM 133350 TaxID=3131992 RepID=UPI00307E3880
MSLLPLPTPLVSTQWLADHLGAEALVVLDATTLALPTAAGGIRWLSGYDEYLIEGHIPGALFIDLLEELSDPSGEFPFTRPTTDQVRGALQDAGVGAESRVVLYDSANNRFAARAWWVLRSFGFERVSVLDGGLPAWKNAGLPVETGHVAATAPASPFEPVAQPGYWADKVDIEQVLAGEQRAALVCSLPAADFAGASASRPRPGHIPGSLSVPSANLVDRQTNRLRPAADVAAQTATLDATEPIILYCAAGILASLGALAFTARGITDVRVYDASLNEWAADPLAPLEVVAD